MSSPPPLPPTPPPPSGGPPTQIAGQQSAPTTTVPHTPGMQPYGYAPAGAQTNSLAVVSFVAGIASFFAHVIPGVGGAAVALVAIITGFMARGQIKTSGEQGMWMANAGIVIGFVHLALIFLVAIVLVFLIFVLGIALFGFAAHGGGTTPSPVPSG